MKTHFIPKSQTQKKVGAISLALALFLCMTSGAFAQTFRTPSGLVDGTSTSGVTVGATAGFTAASALFHVHDDNGTGVNTVDPGFNSLDLVFFSKNGGAAGISGLVAGNSPNNRAVFKGARSRGTVAAPTTPNVNDRMLSFLAAGWDGDETQGTAGVEFIVDGAVSDGNVPGRIAFTTSATDKFNRIERLRILSDGGVEIADIAAPASQTYVVTVDEDGRLGSVASGGGGGPIALNDLTDVNTAGASSGDPLKFDGANWVPGNDLVDDADADPANEIQTISSSSVGTSRTISLSNGGGNTVINVADNDNNASNEIQTISKTGSTVTLSNGGGSFTDDDTDADADPTNEIQDLSLTGNTLSLTGDATTVDLSAYADDGDWAYASGSGLTGRIYHTGNVGIGGSGTAPANPLYVDDSQPGGAIAYIEQSTSSTGSHAVQGNIVINGPTAGFLGVQGATAFNGDSTLNTFGQEIGVLGASTGGSATDNFGVFGHSNGWGGHFQHNSSGNSASFAGTNLAGDFEGNVLIEGGDAAGMTTDGHLQIDASLGENLVIDGDEITARNNGQRETLFLNPDSGRVNIGTRSEWNDASLHVNAPSGEAALRLQLAGSTALYFNSEGTLVVGGYLSSGGPQNGLYVLRDTRLGTSSGNARLDVANTVGTDRDTMIYVNQNSSNSTGTHYGVRVENAPVTTSTSYGFYHNKPSSQTTSGARYGYYSNMNGSSDTGIRYGFYNNMGGGTGTRYGIRSNLNSASGNTSTSYGVYSFVSSAATTGTSYAGYFSSSANTQNQWCLYAVGDSYFSSDVRIATTTQAAGYELSVNGQIACEEVLVADNSNWPDYVFEEDYQLMSLEELEMEIQKQKHLPGIPSAKEVEENGILLGDMQHNFMEKIEELTLYTIQQNKQIKQQNEQIQQLLESATRQQQEIDNLKQQMEAGK